MDKLEMKALGNKIKALRQRAGLTQRELAQMTGISESALRSYELGDRAPKEGIYENLAKALRVRPEYLSVPRFKNRYEFIYALLENEEAYGYKASFDSYERPVIVADDCSMQFGTMLEFLNDWALMRQKLEEKEITEEEYIEWKRTYEQGEYVNGESPWTGKKY
jgi:transcriptional regulator with XRE-family HTH domain